MDISKSSIRVSSSRPSSALPVILSLALLLGASAVLFVYIFAIISFGDASTNDFAGMSQAAMISLFCVAPLVIVSIVAFIVKWKYARYVLVLALVASLMSIGFFAAFVLGIL